MEAKGWILRESTPHDRRIKLLTLSPGRPGGPAAQSSRAFTACRSACSPPLTAAEGKTLIRLLAQDGRCARRRPGDDGDDGDDDVTPASSTSRTFIDAASALAAPEAAAVPLFPRRRASTASTPRSSASSRRRFARSGGSTSAARPAVRRRPVRADARRVRRRSAGRPLRPQDDADRVDGVFGAASLASAFSAGITSLTWLRFLTGVGLGGAMPTAITLTSEYCPTTRRSSLVTLMFCGFTIGSALGGLIAAQVLPQPTAGAPLLVGGGLAPLAARAGALAAAAGIGALSRDARADAQGRVADVLRRIARRPIFDGATFVGTAVSQGLTGAAAVRRRPPEGHAAPVARVLHEPAGRLSAVELDADTDPARPGLARGRGVSSARCSRSAARSAPSSSAG